MRFDYPVVKQLAAPVSPEIPALELSGEVDLGVYDGLLTGGARYPTATLPRPSPTLRQRFHD